jgi:predicted DNA-binding transcriptional regulator YafY
MARAERLMALLDLLRGRSATTVGELARELAVSQRTVLRDLATLRERGMAIAGDAGPGGGVRLERERRTAVVAFSISEVVGIWLAARASRGTSQMPWSQGATAALGKLLASLPNAKSHDIDTLCRRVIVGPPASPTIRGNAGPPPPELLRAFENAFCRGRGLSFGYVDRSGAPTLRTVEPHGLLVQPPVWYILSRDVETGEPRTFRMDRISRPRIVETIAFQPNAEVVRVQVPAGSEWQPLSRVV